VNKSNSIFAKNGHQLLLKVSDITFKNLNLYVSCTIKEVMIMSNWEGFPNV
jgi:hypothetical protein